MKDPKVVPNVSKAIDVLRFPLAVMVVAIHTYFNEGLKARGNVDVPFYGEWAHEFIRLFSIVLTDCAVPMFFVISGYLFFIRTPHLTKTIYIEKIRKKTTTLLIPYIIWCFTACMVNPLRFLSASCIEKITGFWSLSMNMWQGEGPWNGPLWFIRDLFVVMIFAPVVELLLRKMGLIPIFFFLIIYYSGIDNIIPGISVRSFAYFSLGSLLAIKCYNIEYILKGWIVIPVGLFFFTLRCENSFLPILNKTIANCWVLASIALYMWIALFIARHTNHLILWKKLASSGFTIYAMHILINYKIAAFGLMIIGKSSLSGIEAIMLYLVTIITTVALCYFTHSLIIKNKIASHLFEGSRK